MVTIKKRKGFDLEVALRAVSRDRTVHPDGSIASRSFVTVDRWESYLSSALEANGASQAFLDTVIKKSLHHKQEMTEGEFLSVCNRKATALLKTRDTFRVLFPVWPKKEILSGKWWIGDVMINFSPSTATSFYKKSLSERMRVASSVPEGEKYFRLAIGCPLAVATVKAINQLDAFERAEVALSVILGMHSRYLRRGPYIIPKTSRKPVSLILIAPFMTVHQSNGKLQSEMVWYEDWREEPNEVKKDYDQLQRVISAVNLLWLAVKRSKWRERAEIALIKYYKAVSIADGEDSFLETWRLLEYIGGSDSTRYETLIRRAAFYFEEADEMYQLGQHLMFRRNAISHGKRIQSDDGEAIRFQMIEFVEPLLDSFLRNPFEFLSLEEFWSFCDQPVEKEKRERLSFVLESVRKFRRE